MREEKKHETAVCFIHSWDFFFQKNFSFSFLPAHFHGLTWIFLWVDETLLLQYFWKPAKITDSKCKKNFRFLLHKSRGSIQNIGSQDRSLCTRSLPTLHPHQKSWLNPLDFDISLSSTQNVLVPNGSRLHTEPFLLRIRMSVLIPGRASGTQRAVLILDCQELCFQALHWWEVQRLACRGEHRGTSWTPPCFRHPSAQECPNRHPPPLPRPSPQPHSPASCHCPRPCLLLAAPHPAACLVLQLFWGLTMPPAKAETNLFWFIT